MRMILASNNAHKAAELSAILSGLGVETLTLRESGYHSDPEETGTTFAENAYIKAKSLFDISGEAVIADDSGLMVDALGGAPGVYSARYAGEGANDAENNKKLLKNLENTPDGERGAAFVSSICAILPDGRVLRAEGRCPGVILREAAGENGFGYDPLFYMPELHKTFAEMSEEEKNAVSHRARALREFSRIFTEEMRK
ncbi:MAG: XTP/dITP diphosphatase [Clostridia bacterium]|nr:XTP/dITP diphosphatase [Clostridia bacterium]